MLKIKKIEDPKTELEHYYNDTLYTRVMFLNIWYNHEEIRYDWDELFSLMEDKFLDCYSKYKKNINNIEEEDEASFNSYLTKSLFREIKNLKAQSRKHHNLT